MKFAVIYKKPFLLPDYVVIDSDSKDVARMGDTLDKDTFAQFVVDFEEQTITRVLVSKDGLMEIPEGEFGEGTPPEYFDEEEASTMPSPEEVD
jgi:hypothetical protein